MSENHRNEIKIREANLKELKKKLHEAKLNQMRQNKLRDVAICRIARYTLLTAEQKLSLLQIRVSDMNTLRPGNECDHNGLPHVAKESSCAP